MHSHIRANVEKIFSPPLHMWCLTGHELVDDRLQCLQVSDESGQQSPGHILALVLLLLPLSHRHKARPPCSRAALCTTRSEPPWTELCLVGSQLLKTQARATSTCWQPWMGSTIGHACSGHCQAPACAGRAPCSSPAQRQGEASCRGGVLVGGPSSALLVGS